MRIPSSFQTVFYIFLKCIMNRFIFLYMPLWIIVGNITPVEIIRIKWIIILDFRVKYSKRHGVIPFHRNNFDQRMIPAYIIS